MGTEATRRVKSAPRADFQSTISTDQISPHYGHAVVNLDEGRWHCVICDGPYEEPPMRQEMTFLVTLATPHTDEPLDATEQGRNRWEAEQILRQAVAEAGFTLVALEARP